MTRRVLLAGIGNMFFGDDGFGVEVVRRIDPSELPDGVTVSDYGIRGVHLAYDLLDRPVDTLVLIDAVPLDEPPGTLAVLDATEVASSADDSAMVEAHSMNPVAVLQTLRGVGGSVDRALVIGCQPASFEQGMQLSESVQAAVAEAVRLAVELAHAEVSVHA